MPVLNPQFETRQSTRLTLRPQFPARAPVYICTNEQGQPGYVPFDYEGVSSGTIGFTRATAIIRFLPQYYRDLPALPLKSLVANDLRRWEVQVDRDFGRPEHHEVYAVTIGPSGVILELGPPIDALSFPGRPIEQLA